MRRKNHNLINRKTGQAVQTMSNYAQLSIPFLALLIVFCIISYILLTSLTVWNANKIMAFESEMTNASREMVELESSLSSINNKITENLAIGKGFVKNNNVKYITTKPVTSASRSNEMEL